MVADLIGCQNDLLQQLSNSYASLGFALRGVTLGPFCFENQVMEWHRKMEEIRLQELRNTRELVAQKEENQYLKNLVAEQERSISSLEQDIVQQNMVRIKKKGLFFFQQKSWFSNIELVLCDVTEGIDAPTRSVTR